MLRLNITISSPGLTTKKVHIAIKTVNVSCNIGKARLAMGPFMRSMGAARSERERGSDVDDDDADDDEASANSMAT